MKDVKVFKNADLGNVRVAGTQEQPLFCLRDVCEVLELTNTTKVKTSLIYEFGENVGLSYPIIDNLGRTQQATFITEPQLHYILMRSNKPKSKPFRYWIENEVLSQIKNKEEIKTGDYMKQEIKLFKKEDLGQVRIIGNKENPLFCLKDVCDILEHTNSRKAKEVIENEFEEGVIQSYIGVVTGKKADGTDAIQQVATNFITEPQLYYVLMRSDKPKARPFRQWVVNEVLPQIRKTGAYDSRTPKNMVEALELALEQAKQIQALNSKIEEDRPKVEFFEAVAESKDAISIGEVAKTLNLGIGRNKLFDLLRSLSILQNDNIPYQKYIDLGYFRVIEQKYTTPDGETHISLKTLVYQKGLDFIRKIITDMEKINNDFRSDI